LNCGALPGFSCARQSRCTADICSGETGIAKISHGHVVLQK